MTSGYSVENIIHCFKESRGKLYADPWKYATETGKELIADLWDTVPTAIGGYVLTKEGMDSEYAFISGGLAAAGVLSSLLAKGEESKFRALRNLCVGVTAMAVGEGTVLSYSGSVLGKIATVYADSLMYRAKKKNKMPD